MEPQRLHANSPAVAAQGAESLHSGRPDGQPSPEVAEEAALPTLEDLAEVGLELDGIDRRLADLDKKPEETASPEGSAEGFEGQPG